LDEQRKNEKDFRGAKEPIRRQAESSPQANEQIAIGDARLKIIS